ncbi:MAG: protein translocase subunit SecF [Candidatus Shapirobacteria bacterium]
MNIMKFRPLFLLVSSLLIIISIFSIYKWGFNYSEDFTGGSTYEIKLPNTTDDSSIKKIFSDNKIDIRSISKSNNIYTIRFSDISQDQKVKFDSEFKKIDKDSETLQFSSVGPSLGQELIKKTIYALILSSLSLLLFIGFKFSDFSFGTGAVLAMFHDSFILIGAFSLFGHFWGAQLDTLFVTALLTTLSASVHDTVVTFDRIRELRRKHASLPWTELANQAVSEVIVRSINNSMTIIFMLFALVLLGGSTTRWFATALLVGVISGTYSSTAVAIPLVLLFKKKK